MMRKYKIAEQSYTQSMLPQTRKAVFFDVVKLQWRSLLILGMILLAFALPEILLNLARDSYAIALYTAVEKGTDVERVQAGYMIMVGDVLKNFIQIIGFAIYGVGLAGVMRVLRQYAWGENIHIPTDFGRGIKDNWKPMLGLSILTGVLYAVCYYLYYLANVYRTDEMLLLSVIPIALCVLFVMPMFACCLVMIPVYNNTLFQIIKMSFYVCFRGYGKVLLGTVCTVVLWALSLLPSTAFHFGFGMISSLAAPFFLLGWTLFCYNRLDKDLNPSLCPELIGKGLYKPAQEGSEEY